MMLLRSSSTPIICTKHEPTGCGGGGGGAGASTSSSSKTTNHEKVSFMIDPCSFTRQLKGNIRRVSSDGNLMSTALLSLEDQQATNDLQLDSPTISSPRSPFKNIKKCKTKPNLDPIPSFSVYNGGLVEEAEDIDDYSDKVSEFSFPFSNGKVSDNGEFGYFNFSNWDNGKHFRSASKEQQFHHPERTSLYMATGLGIEPDLTFLKRDGQTDDDQMQRHYEELVMENPCNPLILRNYAQYLYETRRDYTKAEELYSRAILADPDDGEILSDYAKLKWEVRGEEETASNYFVSAVHACPDNSNVLAAYASFLWDTDEREEEQDTMKHQQPQEYLCHSTQ